MSGFERVSVRPETGKPFTIYLRNVETLGDHLSGIEVDREGDDIVPKGHDERLHIITLDLVTERTPMVAHNLYGHLVERDTVRFNTIGWAQPGSARTYAVWVGNRFCGYVRGIGRAWCAVATSDPLTPAPTGVLTPEHSRRADAAAALIEG